MYVRISAANNYQRHIKLETAPVQDDVQYNTYNTIFQQFLLRLLHVHEKRLIRCKKNLKIRQIFTRHNRLFLSIIAIRSKKKKLRVRKQNSMHLIYYLCSTGRVRSTTLLRPLFYEFLRADTQTVWVPYRSCTDTLPLDYDRCVKEKNS